ncbi:MAG: hypothetical protein K9G76_06030 [Bacteroidales bacterium]|nr:hypothetical protein [Bacteroidales bacterium]MCF8402413.1 hypothetical protein [Bacteroidales bacterium]
MKIYDLHAHPSIKAYGNRFEDGKFDIWKDRKHFLPKLSLIDRPFTGLLSIFNRPVAGYLRGNLEHLGDEMAAMISQANLKAASQGKVKCIFLSIYPVEREFYTRGKKKEKGTQDKLQSWISGQSVDYVDDVQAGRFSYWDQYLEEIKLLVEGQAKELGNTQWKYKIITSYEDFEIIEPDENTIGIIISAEGIQSMASNIKGQDKDFFALKKAAKKNTEDFKNWRKQLLENIKYVKENQEIKKYSPLYVTVAHHFFNYITGHCKSLMDVRFGPLGALIFKQDGKYEEDGENLSYYEWGFVGDYGKSVFKELLRRDPANNIRRIIVDIKHLSPQSRLEYYKMLETEYVGENIPVLCSHTACNGVKKLVHTISNKMKEESEFQVMELNTYDEDIIKIYETGGVMGLMLDDSRICCKGVSKQIKQHNRKIDKYEREIDKNKRELEKTEDIAKQKKLIREINSFKGLIVGQEVVITELYCMNFFRQVFHVVKVLQGNPANAGNRAWDILCIGSDYDGAISPMDLYGSYSRIDEFADDLVKHWESRLVKPDAFDELDYQASLFGKDPEHWIRKVFETNLNDFLRKYFHEDYLVHGNVH